jgi:hypothetical protein
MSRAAVYNNVNSGRLTMWTFEATKEGEKIILSPVSVSTAPNITIIYDRDNHKPKSIVLGPKLIKTDEKIIVLSDGSVLM